MAQNLDDNHYTNDARDEQGDMERVTRQYFWLPSSPTPAPSPTSSIELQEMTNDNESSNRPLHIIRAGGWTNLDEPVSVMARQEWPCAVTEPYVPIAGRSPELGMMRKVGFVILPSVAVVLPTKRLHSANPSSQPSTMDIGKACRPKKPAAGGACGEDACLVAPLADNKILMAVADGVGGWRKRGVDPSLFSNQLLLSLQAVSASPKSDEVNPLDLLKRAFWHLVDLNAEKKVQSPGSSTACLAVIDNRDKNMLVCNVGDSGLLVVRPTSNDEEVVFRTSTQQTAFNAPLQLTLFPGPSGHALDPTAQSESKSVQLASGDCVILATDGLLDNLFAEEIVAIVKEYRRVGAQRIADSLVHAAYRASVRSDTTSPFSVEAHKAGKFHVGGKPDDITVLVGII